MSTKVKNFNLLFMILLMTFTIGQIASIIFVPALPKVTAVFNCTDATIQWSVSSFMFGLAFSQFVYGPFSDKHGRRITLSIGVMIGLVGTVICLLAFSPAMLIIGRLVQGIGLGVGSAMSYVILRDLFVDEELARYGSILGMLAPAFGGIAPILGGYLASFFGWRSIFIFLLAYGFLLWILVTFLLQETKVIDKDKQSNFKDIVNDFRILLSSKVFLGYTLCTLLAYSGFMAFYTLGPYLLAEFGVSTVASGWLLAVSDLAIVVGSAINIMFVVKYGINKMMFIGTALMILAGCLLLISKLFGYVNTPQTVIPVFIFAFGAVLNMCNAFSGALSPFPEVSGTAGGLLSGMQILGGAIGCSIVAILATFDKETVLSGIYIVLGIITFLALKMATGKKQKE